MGTVRRTSGGTEVPCHLHKTGPRLRSTPRKERLCPTEIRARQVYLSVQNASPPPMPLTRVFWNGGGAVSGRVGSASEGPGVNALLLSLTLVLPLQK